MYEHPARRAPSQAPAVFYFETEGMCIGENNIRRPGDHRERAEGERPGPGPAKQRWEAVFRRERRPASLDRQARRGLDHPARGGTLHMPFDRADLFKEWKTCSQ